MSGSGWHCALCGAPWDGERFLVYQGPGWPRDEERRRQAFYRRFPQFAECDHEFLMETKPPIFGVSLMSDPALFAAMDLVANDAENVE